MGYFILPMFRGKYIPMSLSSVNVLVDCCGEGSGRFALVFHGMCYCMPLMNNRYPKNDFIYLKVKKCST